MTYSDFTLEMVHKSLGVAIGQTPLFAEVDRIEPPSWLEEALAAGLQLALISEKARSEFIVVPILLTSRKLNKNCFAIYSGQRLDVNPEQGLSGECDFILTQTPPLPLLQSPIVTILEAKKNDIEGGLGQCAAQMVGACQFNQRAGTDNPVIFGCVTTGEAWQFLKLEKSLLSLDSRRYYIDAVGDILGVFQAIMAVYQPPTATEEPMRKGETCP